MPSRASSLIELKKRQWEKEKVEDMNYGGIWRHFSDAEEPKYRPCLRGQFKSNLDLKSYAEDSHFTRKRTPSLPPINSGNYDTLQIVPPDEGDTSGYASDSAGNEYNLGEARKKTLIWPQAYRKTPETSERAKWGDRGIGIGHLWTPSPHLPQANLPVVERTTPSWLNRGFNEPPQVLVITHDDTESVHMSEMSDECQRSFLRGQTTPSDPQVIADRERRRQKALEQHNAIKEQVEEKERKRKEEQERLEKEEKEEEMRLKRYQEIELLRIEEEKRKQREKAEKEERIAKAMKEALEIAEKRAKEEKAARRKHIRKESPVNDKKEENVEKEENYEKEKEMEKSDSGIESSAADDECEEIEKEATREDATLTEISTPEETPVVETPQEVSVPQEPIQEPEMTEMKEITVAVSEIRIETEEIDASRLCVLPSPGRILTPSIFRGTSFKHKSTQTDSKTRQGRSKSIRMEDRPKWGVNRPTVRYIKASDRDPYRKAASFRQNDSRSPSPLNNSKTSFLSYEQSSNSSSGSSSSLHKLKTSRGVGTPRTVHVLPNTGIIKKSSAGKRYLSIKNSGKINRSGSGRKRPELSDILTVKEVLEQISALKKGLIMKKQEWAVTRSPTPFSEVSSVS